MDSLFSDDPQYRRNQYRKLSDNVREWQQEIAGLVSERLPSDLGLDTQVIFQKVDDEKGYGIGAAIVQDGATGEKIGVPLIIKSWHLAPVDLFFKDDQIYPLTDENLAKIFYQSSLGSGLAPEKPPLTMADDVFADVRNPPIGGKYSYSAPFSMLQLLHGTLGAEDIQQLKTAALSRPEVLARYHDNGTYPVLAKYGQEKPKPNEQDKINRERTMAVFTVKKDGPDAYRLYSAPDDVYDPVLITTDRQGLKHFLEMRRAELWDYEQDPLNSIDQYGHFTIEQKKSPYDTEIDGPAGALGARRNAFVFDPREDDRIVRTIDKFGRYAVKDRDGVMAKGWVLPNVVDFDGNTKPIKLFLGKALASMQSRIAGFPLNDDADVTMRAERPDTGKIGTLIYRDGERVLATVPFQVTAVTVFRNLRSLTVNDYQGNQLNLILSPTIDGIIKVTDSKSAELGPLLGPKANYLVSAKMFFVKMPRLCPVSETPDDFKSMAVKHLDVNPVKVAQANGRYILRGGAISKYASRPLGGHSPVGQKIALDFNSLQRHEAEFLLRYWGLDREKTAAALDATRDRISVEVHHLRFPSAEPPVKTASMYAQHVPKLRIPIPELVKTAANIDDAQTVDAILGLGFINEENINRFASAQPMLWEVCHMLAKLLLAARLGMTDIPEDDARAALHHLQRVLEGLGRLKMLKEQQVKTSSARPQPRHVGGRLVPASSPLGVAR
jgi:hypothetical protein